jgi:hypothetical protein
METKELQARIKGKVTTATDYGYEQLRRAMLIRCGAKMISEIQGLFAAR